MTTDVTTGLTGSNLIAGAERAGGPRGVQATDPRTGESGGVTYAEATTEEVTAAARAAGEVADGLAGWPLERRAQLLRAVAHALDADADALVAIADAETALGETRLSGELARASGQFRMFADVVAEGALLEAIIDHADPDATPPRPDLRRMLLPLGPVAVFGASNFPLAFSIPGGDTAVALAAGCPVVAKGHPSHPGTSERAARAILRGLADVGASPGVFNLVQGAGHDVGQALVTAPQIRAVGFTGSQAAGRALHDLTAGRDEPIPVYAEMSSINPLFVTESAATTRGGEIADGLLGSMTLGTGQFCTKPGVAVVPDGPAGEAFTERLAAGAREHQGGPLLNERIRQALAQQLEATGAVDGVEVLADGGVSHGDGFAARPVVLRAPATRFLSEPHLSREHFGPVTIVVTGTPDDAVAVAESFDGQLASAIHAEPDDSVLERLLPVLTARSGRIVWNGYPTGVAVTHAMHHGGPYPATTNPLHTSVGSTAVRRFQRPVAFQDAPEQVLPAALRDDDPLGIPRRVDGTLVVPEGARA